MAKRKASDPLICTGFLLTLSRDPGNNFEVSLTAYGPGEDDDRQACGLHYTKVKDDQPDLVKALLRAIADKWPNCDWQFTANDNDEVTRIISSAPPIAEGN